MSSVAVEAPGAPDGGDLERRRSLGGSLPRRVLRAKPLTLPGDKVYAELKQGSGKNKIATTMAVVRLLKDWMKDPEIGKRFVPIAPDEYRTFGMDSMFPSAKIYSPHGQTYESVDRKLLLAYKESVTGQLLHADGGAHGRELGAARLEQADDLGLAEITAAVPDDELRKLMDYVMGSGQVARTYFTEDNGRLFQLLRAGDGQLVLNRSGNSIRGSWRGASSTCLFMTCLLAVGASRLRRTGQHSNGFRPRAFA